MSARTIAVLALAAACTRAPAPAPEAPRPAYFLAAAGGARAFDEPAAAAAADATTGEALLPGFGVSIVEQRFLNGRRVGRTARGRWIALAQLEPARPAALAGVVLADANVAAGGGGNDVTALDFAWVVNDGAPVLASAAAGAATLGTRPLWSRERLSVPCPDEATHCRTGAGWMRAADLRAPALSPRPAGVGPEERWIDVELATQTLVAYEGDRPVFTTLIAGGIGRPGSALATPEGLFRVRSKLATATMDNLEHTGVVPYRYEDIPLVQYVTERVALHAALWHRRFGHPASHGCINLAPADAERLFAFTSPTLAPGESGVAASAHAPGTAVRVRRR